MHQHADQQTALGICVHRARAATAAARHIVV
jgi:hypothetical protein